MYYIPLIFNNNVFIFQPKNEATKVLLFSVVVKLRLAVNLGVFSWVEYYSLTDADVADGCCCMVLWNVLSENPHNHNHESSRKITTTSKLKKKNTFHSSSFLLHLLVFFLWFFYFVFCIFIFFYFILIFHFFFCYKFLSTNCLI